MRMVSRWCRIALPLWKHLGASCIAIVVYHSTLIAQNPVCIRYKIDDGLPSNEVYDIAQDVHGDLWFATDHGISKFDGYAFTNLSTREGLSDNTVYGFTKDATGGLWMRCTNGTLSYLDLHGDIHPYVHNGRLRAQLQNGWIENLVCSSDGQIYLTTSTQRSFRLDLRSGNLYPITFPTGTNTGMILVPGTHQHLMVMQNSIVGAPLPPRQIQRVGPSSYFWAHDTTRYHIYAPARPIVAQFLNGDWMIAYGKQLVHIAGGRIVTDSTLPFKVNNLNPDRQGNIWMAGTGISRLDTNLHRVDEWFADEVVMAMLQDREGSYWLATTDGVLFVRNPKFRSYRRLGVHELGEVKRLRLVDSTLYLDSKDPLLYAVRLSKHIPDLAGDFQTIPIMDAHPRDFLVLPDHERLLIYNRIYEIADARFNQLPNPNHDLAPGAAWTHQLYGNHFWVGGNKGFARYVLGPRDQVPKRNHTYEGPICSAIVEDTAGVVWIGKMDGLFTYDGKRLRRFRSQGPASHARITGLLALPDGGIIAATRGQGIVCIGGKFPGQLRVEDGLASNLCDRIYLGPSGLWACSYNGLTLIRPPSATSLTLPEMLNFKAGDGLPTNQINDVVEFGGRAYVATLQGLVVFEVPQVKAELPMPPIRILGLETNLKNYETDAQMSTEEDFLHFSFTAPLLPMPNKVEYEYRLDGRDLTPRVTTERSATYYDLPPGTYHFRVRARTPQGPWGPEARFEVYRPQKFYATSWFQGGLLLLASVILSLIAWLLWRSRQRRRLANLYRLQAEVKALRSQMQPHFIFNALNSIQELILLQDNASAQMHLISFATLMRNILEATNHETIPISLEVEILTAYLELERLRLGDHFAFHIHLEQDVDWAQQDIPPMLLQPLVENAIWHGLQLQKNKPTLWLRFSRVADGTVCIAVEDNGIGRKAAAQIKRTHLGTSVAIANIQERIRLINATRHLPLKLEIIDLQHDDETARGTCIQLFLPPSEDDNPSI